jgi:hypothetical protein
MNLAWITRAAFGRRISARITVVSEGDTRK